MEKEKTTLTLTLKKKWFDMILSGEKKEEYREDKFYWQQRLSILDDDEFIMHRSFDYIKFKNGYAKDCPTMVVKCLGVEMAYGDDENWGAPKEKCYIIKLGQILETLNLKK